MKSDKPYADTERSPVRIWVPGYFIKKKYLEQSLNTTNKKNFKPSILKLYMDEKLKTIFLNVYSNLPINERKNIIVVLEGKEEKTPISWDIAYAEVDHETKLGEEILDKLIKLDLI